MGARGDLGHHAAIGPVLVELAEHDVGQDFARPRRAAAHHGGGGFVAAGFDAQNRQARKAVRPLIGSRQSSKPFGVMPQNRTLRLGTRGSKLALVQANMVADLLHAKGAASEIVVLKTTGDRIQDRPLADAGGKGLFVKELEDALLRNDDRSCRPFDEGRADRTAARARADRVPAARRSERGVPCLHKARALADLPQGRTGRNEFGAPPGPGGARGDPISTSSCCAAMSTRASASSTTARWMRSCLPMPV